MQLIYANVHISSAYDSALGHTELALFRRYVVLNASSIVTKMRVA
jgi:hypothetical protein